MNKQQPPPRPGTGTGRTRGFTLVEMMMTIGVLSILLALAGPSFVDVVRNNRVATQTNDLVGALALARNEAARRGIPVSVCAATADQTACAGDATDDWANGWLTFVDATGTPGTIDDDDVLLQVSRRPDASVFVRTDSIGFVRYGRSGAPTNVESLDAGETAIHFEIRHQTCDTDDGLRMLDVERTGRTNLSRQACETT